MEGREGGGGEVGAGSGSGGGERGGEEKRRGERGKKNDLMKFRYQLRTNMQNISLEIK